MPGWMILPKFTTMRLRLVINSSLKCMCKGPNLLIDLWELLMRFRTYRHVLISDVMNAYHALRTGLLELHLRQVVWRHGDGSECLRLSGCGVRDCQEAVLLQGVIRSIDIRAAEKIQNDLFVDDLVIRGELDEVDRFLGEKNKDDFKCLGTMTQIMEKGGLHFKGI